MALFEQYTQPGVYTSVTTEDAGVSLFGDARVIVLVGEGNESNTFNNVELHRGSSSVVDDRKTQENLSDQVDGTTRTFQVSYYPIVKGDGRGTTTSSVADIAVYADGNQINVSSINGATGQFTIDNILPVGTDLRVDYFFKRSDTLVTAEDLSVQVPQFATLSTQGGKLILKLQNPGFLGNNVTVTFTSNTGAPKSDALAVTGQGTDAISIEIQKGTISVPATRTVGDLVNLVNAGIITQSGGNVLVSSSNTLGANAVAASAANFAGGLGQSTNTTYKVKNTPIVDGTNGGVVTNLASSVVAKVNGNVVAVSGVDGANGLVTLASGVTYGSTLTLDYFTNTYQDTFDFLPAENITSITEVGFSPDRSDFIDGTDFVLEGNKIQWGSSASVVNGQQTSGYVALDGTYVTTTLVDDKTYLELATGTVNGINNVFTLKDAPTDGSGLSRVTDNPVYVKVYVGTTPVTALAAGVVTVSRVSGVNKQVTLANPPATGNVYVTYWKNRLADNQFTMKVTTPGVTGQGKYSLTDKNGKVVPVDSEGTHTVADTGFTTSGGIVWPNSFSDLKSPAGVVDETVTLTFQNTGETYVTTPGTQASNTTVQTGITFRATTVGTGGNSVTIQLKNTGPTADGSALTVTGNAVVIEIQKGDTTTRTLQDVVNLFTTYPPTSTGGGVITATLTGTGTTLATTAAAANLAGGNNPITAPFSTKYQVTSNVTGGSGGTGVFGYLGQTYTDAVTGITFTVVDPNNALDYGFTTPPASYHYQAGDTLVFLVNKTTTFTTSSTPKLGIPGLRTKVTTTFGMATNDYALVNTYNKAGNEPKVGEFYYVSYVTAKTDKDFELKLFTNLSDIFAQYGNPTVTNKLSLAANLAVQNGATTLGCLQVKKDIGSELASDQTYIDAISSLARPIGGSQNKPAVIVPLTTSQTVQQFLAKHLDTQAAPRNKGEGIGFMGFPLGTTPAAARQRARGIKSARVIALYPAGAIVSIEIDGKSAEFAVGGEFQAAAMAGMSSDPAIDVATTLTRRKMVGFQRLATRYDDPTMDQMAADGITLLIEDSGAFVVRHYKTTDPSNPTTSEPTTTTITDSVRQRIRRELNQFIGRKNLGALVNDVTIVMNSLMKTFVQQEIIEAYKGLEVTRDENDPTVLNVKVAFKPVFSLLYINVQLKVTTKS